MKLECCKNVEWGRCRVLYKASNKNSGGIFLLLDAIWNFIITRTANCNHYNYVCMYVYMMIIECAVSTKQGHLKHHTIHPREYLIMIMSMWL